MRRDEQADALVAEHVEDGYVFPTAGEYTFARVAPTALSVLGAAPAGSRTLPSDVFTKTSLADIRHVVVVLVDGLGYDAWSAAESDVPFLAAMSRGGTITPLLTVYPSETAAAIPTLHTGVPPVSHGLLGWHQYIERLPGVVHALPWTTPAGDPVPGVARDPADWQRLLLGADPLYERVDLLTHVLQPADVAESLSGLALTRGVDERLGYYNAADAALGTRRVLTGADSPSYTLVYLPDVDTVGHRDGPGSDGTRTQIASVGAALERELCGRLDPSTAARTLLVVTADHGQVDTRGENVDIRGYDPIRDNLATGPDGEPIPPVGGSRNLQLFLADGTAESVREALERDFDCRAMTRPEYEERALFGRGDPCDQYRQRAPHLVCIHRNRGLWYEDDDLGSVGKHGGLTRTEMLVPFGAARLDELHRALGD